MHCVTGYEYTLSGYLEYKYSRGWAKQNAGHILGPEHQHFKLFDLPKIIIAELLGLANNFNIKMCMSHNI